MVTCIMCIITSIYIENSIGQCYNFYLTHHIYFGHLKRNSLLYFVYWDNYHFLCSSCIFQVSSQFVSLLRNFLKSKELLLACLSEKVLVAMNPLNFPSSQNVFIPPPFVMHSFTGYSFLGWQFFDCCCLVAKSCLTLFCDPGDWSLPGFFVHGISQARILEWVAISFSKWSSQARYRTHIH